MRGNKGRGCHDQNLIEINLFSVRNSRSAVVIFVMLWCILLCYDFHNDSLFQEYYIYGLRFTPLLLRSKARVIIYSLW